MDENDLAFAGIAAQAELLQARTVSSRELVELYLKRIDAINPSLNAFAEVFADQARTAADAADQRLAAGESAPLLGVPVAFKDELDIAGRIAQHGSAGAFDRPATSNAVHVQRMLDAGAVAIGVTNLPELAMCGFTESDANGDTVNPWDPTRTPGGSSGGSAAAVAAGLVGAASASDGAGSIRIPAALCGLVGLMPQRGRISLAPEAQHWHGMSRTGCLTRRVVDTALWLDVAAGPAPGDAHVPPSYGGSYLEATRAAAPPLRIATSVKPPRSLVPPIIDEEIVEAIASTATVLGELGHAVVDRTPDYGGVGNDYPVMYLAGIADHFAEVPRPDRLEARTRGMARLGRAIPDRVMRAAQRRESTHSQRINALFDDVDVLVTPVTGTLPVEVGRWRGQGALRTVLGMGRVYPFTATWNYLGQPAMAVPVGLSRSGLPLSAMLIGPPNSEPTLLSLAHQLEQVMDWPKVRPPVD